MVQRAQDELSLLQNALRDIAHAVLQDAENKNTDATAQPASHLHLSTPSLLPPRFVSNNSKFATYSMKISPFSSGKGNLMRGPTSPAFAESTISAVQAALHKHQLQAHELHVGLINLGVKFF